MELGELFGLIAEDLEAAFQVVLDEFELFRRITRGVLKGGSGEALVHSADSLKGFGTGADEYFAAVAGVAKAFDEAGLFQAVEDASDGAGGQASGAGEVSRCEWSLRITRH